MDRRLFLQMAVSIAAALNIPIEALAAADNSKSKAFSRRQIVLNTDTTGIETVGIDMKSGHRIVNIACVELIDHKKSGRFYHQYINPEREVWPGAQQVHGLTLEQLQYKPKFAEIAPALLNFISGAELITHSAAFHCGFLNKELEEAGLKALINYCPTIIDTLKLAEKQHPDQQNSLTALGVRYQLDHLHRNLKGALADVDLNAEIYLAMSKDQAI